MAENILNQFKKLQEEIGPSAEWTEKTRNFLFAKVEQDTLIQETSIFDHLRLFLNVGARRFSVVSVRVAVILVTVGLIGSAGMFAQAEANPKTLLYSVKRAIEKIEFVLAVSPASETKVYLKHATKRKDEALKLAQKSDFTASEKDSSIDSAIKSMEKDINAAQDSLAIINASKEQGEETAVLAKEITNSVKENMQALDQVQQIVGSEGVDATVAEAKNTMEEAESASLEFLLSSGTAVISEDELKEIINNKIQRATEKINQLNAVIAGVDLNKVIIVKEVSLGTLNIKTRLNIAEVVNQAQSKANEAQNALDQAKSTLTENDFSGVLEDIKASYELFNQAKRELAKVLEKEEISEEESATPESSLESSNDNNESGKSTFDQPGSSGASSTSETTPEALNQPVGAGNVVRSAANLESGNNYIK